MEQNKSKNLQWANKKEETRSNLMRKSNDGEHIYHKSSASRFW